MGKFPAWVSKPSYISAKLGKDELLKRITVSQNHSCRNLAGLSFAHHANGQVASEYLSSIDQDVSTKIFDTVAEALIQPSILRHRDEEIRLLAACCLADVMRVYAPDPPYDDETTKV